MLLLTLGPPVALSLVVAPHPVPLGCEALSPLLCLLGPSSSSHVSPPHPPLQTSPQLVAQGAWMLAASQAPDNLDRLPSSPSLLLFLAALLALLSLLLSLPVLLPLLPFPLASFLFPCLLPLLFLVLLKQILPAPSPRLQGLLVPLWPLDAANVWEQRKRWQVTWIWP